MAAGRRWVRDACGIALGTSVYGGLTALSNGFGPHITAQILLWAAGMAIVLLIHRTAAPAPPGGPRTVGDRMFATPVPGWLVAAAAAALFVAGIALLRAAASSGHARELWGFSVEAVVLFAAGVWLSGCATWRFRKERGGGGRHAPAVELIAR